MTRAPSQKRNTILRRIATWFVLTNPPATAIDYQNNGGETWTNADGVATAEFEWSGFGVLPDDSIDADNDGLSDYEEIHLLGTDPNNVDSDGDGMADGWDAKPLTAADSPAFGQSATWLAAAGVHGTTNALEWAQGVVAEDPDAIYLVGLSVEGATPAFPASVSPSGFPTVVLDDDATLWFPVAVAETYAFDFRCDAELDIGIAEPPPRLLLRSGNDEVHTVEGTDGWNLVSTAWGKRGWYMRKPWQQLRNCTGEINSTWMSFEVETSPRKGGTHTWSSMPEAFLQRVDGNRALCLWPDDSQVGTAVIRVVWEKDAFAVTNFLVIGRPLQQENETPLLSLDIDGGDEGVVFVRTNGLGQVSLQNQDPAQLTCRVASTSAVASVTLDCPQSGKVRIRTMVNDHDTEISLPYTWNPQTTGEETVFQIRGTETSGAVRDIRFTAAIPDTPVSADVDMTVARVEHQTLSTYPPGRRHRTVLGVGEEVEFHLEPMGVYPNSSWTFTNCNHREDNDRCFIEAPDIAGECCARFSFLGKSVQRTFSVLAPTGYGFQNSGIQVSTDNYLPSGAAGGFEVTVGTLKLRPGHVSFYRLVLQEGSCLPESATGSFATIYSPPAHDVPNGAYRTVLVGEDNNAGSDTLRFEDGIPPVEGDTGWRPGGFQWDIPVTYEIPASSGLLRPTLSSSDDEPHVFCHTPQTFSLSSDGTLTIEKFGLSFSCTTNRVLEVRSGQTLINTTNLIQQ